MINETRKLLIKKRIISFDDISKLTSMAYEEFLKEKDSEKDYFSDFSLSALCDDASFESGDISLLGENSPLRHKHPMGIEVSARGLRPAKWTLEIKLYQRKWIDSYPTQKPQALLERIIETSTNPGGLVLDPFCGCGTTVHAAQKTGRQWIGIDVTYLAINLIKRRLKDAFGDDVQFEEKGQPTDFGGAQQLFKNNPWQFQQWALSLIDARPRTEGDGKGADRGVDGMLYFYESKDKREKILVQVKGGGVQRNDVATLLGDVNNQKFVGGILITLEKSTKPMRIEAADAGRYTSKLWHKKDYPKIQILTIEGLLDGTERVDSPPQENPFAKAGLETISGKHTSGKQTDLI